jgi:hypothetical protein
VTRISLNDATQEEREEYMEQVFRTCVEHRQWFEPMWLDLWEEWRGVTDLGSLYRNKLKSVYAFTAVMSMVSQIEPMFFASDPVVEIASKWEEDWPDNAAHEALLTKQVHSRSSFRQAWDSSLLEAAVFGASFPYNQWVNDTRIVGPFPGGNTEGGPALLGPDGTTLSRSEYREVQLYNGPGVKYTTLWDSFIHPDNRRGFSLVDMTGYEMLRAAGGPRPMFDPQRVNRAIKVLERDMKSEGSKNRDDMNFAWGDNGQVDRDQLAQVAGTESGIRHMWDAVDPTIRKDLLAFPFPVYFYDDGEFSGAYLSSKSGRFFELRFFRAASVDGTPNRMKLHLLTTPGETYNPSLLEVGIGLIQARSKWLQLTMDGMELTAHPQWIVSDQYDRLNGQLLTGPGAVNVVPSLGGRLSDHMERQDLPQAWVNAVGAREQVIDSELDDLFQQDEHTKGQFPSGRHTAAEANLVGLANSARIELVADRVSMFFANPLLKKWDIMNRAYLSKQDYKDLLGERQAADVKHRDIEEILRRNDYVFKGSVLSSTKSQMIQRYPSMASAYLEALPFMQLPHVQEYFKRWFRDAGMEAITRLFPEADGNVRTDFMSGGGKFGLGEMPKSPTDAAGQLAAAGGETAPRPPPNDFGPIMRGQGATSESQRKLSQVA